jgi:hypothetical protein
MRENSVDKVEISDYNQVKRSFINKGEKTMTEPKILAQDEHGNRRIVELEVIHEIDSAGSLTQIKTASLYESGVNIVCIGTGQPEKTLWLDADVMNALASSWAKFQSDIEAAAKAEEERKNTLIAEAYALAARHPEIKIETDGTASPGWWRVSIPSQAYRFMQPAYYPTSLMEQVKTCAEVLTKQRRVTGGDAA